MKHYLLLGMVLILASCQKAIDKPATSSTTDDGMAFVDTTNSTERISDTTWFYDNEAEGEYLFDSCTNEYVHIWGNIHSSAVHYFQDSVKQTAAGETDYQNFHAIGRTTGNAYTFKENIKSIQYDEWGGEWFINRVTFYHYRVTLAPKIDNPPTYVIDKYYYFVSDDAGNLIINKQHYDFGSCH